MRQFSIFSPKKSCIKPNDGPVPSEVHSPDHLERQRKLLTFHNRPTQQHLKVRTRCLQQHGGAKVDDPSAISGDLANEVSFKALRLEAVFSSEYHREEYAGQGGIVEVSTDKFLPCTAKHCVEDHEKEKLFWNLKCASCFGPNEFECVPNFDKKVSKKFLLCTQPNNQDYDISWGAPIDFVRSKQSFKLVSSNFKIRTGMKIGIAILNNFGRLQPTKPVTTPKAPGTTDLSQDELVRYFGYPGEVVVLTGEITQVNEDVIQYDVNSYDGCSGAIVFLLDQQQSDVHAANFGKAIAVHSGTFLEGTKTNFAYILKHPDDQKSSHHLLHGWIKSLRFDFSWSGKKKKPKCVGLSNENA